MAGSWDCAQCGSINLRSSQRAFLHLGSGDGFILDLRRCDCVLLKLLGADRILAEMECIGASPKRDEQCKDGYHIGERQSRAHASPPASRHSLDETPRLYAWLVAR